jgi:hypothetical protein
MTFIYLSKQKKSTRNIIAYFVNTPYPLHPIAPPVFFYNYSVENHHQHQDVLHHDYIHVSGLHVSLLLDHMEREK